MWQSRTNLYLYIMDLCIKLLHTMSVAVESEFCLVCKPRSFAFWINSNKASRWSLGKRLERNKFIFSSAKKTSSRTIPAKRKMLFSHCLRQNTFSSRKNENKIEIFNYRSANFKHLCTRSSSYKYDMYGIHSAKIEFREHINNFNETSSSLLRFML